jgi:hypothetical protein
MDTTMKTIDSPPAVDPLQEADSQAVMRHAFHGEPLDPEVERRVRERSEKITERVYLTRGLIDDETFQSLFDDES